MTITEKSAVNEWVTLTIGKIKRKSIRKEVVLQKNSKQDGCYLVLLKVQYRSSHFRILWKTLSPDYRPEGKIIISNLRNYTAYWYKAKKNWWRYFD